MQKHNPLKGNYGKLILPIIAVLVLAAIALPSPTNIVNNAMTYTTPPVATIPRIKVHITNTWAGFYGLIRFPEIINDAEFLPEEQAILLAGDVGTPNVDYVILDPVGARGRSTLYGGPTALIQVDEYVVQSAQGLYYDPHEGLYIAGYVQKTKEDPPHVLVMSVDPTTATVQWATVLNVFNASKGLDLTMVHQGEGNYLAVVGWARIGTEKDALLVKVDASTGNVLSTYLIGRPGIEEEATAVATNDMYELITINGFSEQNVAEPLVVMTDWGTFVDAFVLTSTSEASMGFLNDIEFVKLHDGTDTVTVVGTDTTKTMGVAAMLRVTPIGLDMIWCSIDRLSDDRLVYNGVTAYISTDNEPSGELVIAGTMWNVTSNRLQAVITERSLLNSLRSFVTLYSDGHTEGIEAFAEEGVVEYHWVGGRASGFSPFNDLNPFAGRLGEQFELPLNLDWVSCLPRPNAKYVEPNLSIKYLQLGEHTEIPITEHRNDHIQPQANNVLREQQECVAYPYFYLRWLVDVGNISLVTVTSTELVIHNVTVTHTALVTEVAETTITCTNEVTSTRTEETTVTHTVTETYTQTLTSAEERWVTYASLGIGGLTLIFILAVLVKVFRA